MSHDEIEKSLSSILDESQINAVIEAVSVTQSKESTAK